MVPTRWIVGLSICAVALYVVLGAMNLYFGDLNQDEGWYLYAARQVHEGQLPYRDFAFTQGPMLPLVYSLAQPLVDRWGVAGGRLFSAVLGFLGALAAAWLAARSSPEGGWARCRASRLHPDRRQRLPELFHHGRQNVLPLRAVSGRRGCWPRALRRPRAGRAAVLLSGVLLALAAGTRHSAGAALPVVFLWLVFKRRIWAARGGSPSGWAARWGSPRLPCPSCWSRARDSGSPWWSITLRVRRAVCLQALCTRPASSRGSSRRSFVPACLGAALILWRRLRSEPVGVTAVAFGRAGRIRIRSCGGRASPLRSCILPRRSRTRTTRCSCSPCWPPRWRRPPPAA